MANIKNNIPENPSQISWSKIQMLIQGESLSITTFRVAIVISFLVFLLPSILLTRFNTPASLMAGIALLLVLIHWTLTYLIWKGSLQNSNDLQILSGILLGLAIALLGQMKTGWLNKTLFMIAPLLIIMLFHPRGGGRFLNLPTLRK